LLKVYNPHDFVLKYTYLIHSCSGDVTKVLNAIVNMRLKQRMVDR